MFAARYPMAQDPGVPIAAPSTETEAKPATQPLRPMEGRTDPHGSAQEIPRNAMQKAIGNMGGWIQSMAEQLDKYGVKIKLPGTDVELNPTLKDVTLGDMGRVLEDISYGFYPARGKHMTFGLKPEATELLNLPIVAMPAIAAAKAAPKAAAALTAASIPAVKKDRTISYDEKGKRVKP
jgi:hypothetical protein